MGTSPQTPRSWRRRLVRLGLCLLVPYGVITLLLVALENWLLFPGTPASAHWQESPSAQIQDVELTTADGTRLHGWWLPRDGAKGAVLYCHGNGGNLSHRGSALLDWSRELGESVFIFDYPGYGKSEGSPNEANCYAAGEAAYDWLVHAQHIPAERIILFGKSLGGGVATELALHRPHRALVLVKAFTSAPDVAQRHYFWLPVQWLMRNRFENLAKIGKCPRPVFLAHGTADGLIPCTHSERLFAAAREPKSFLRLEGDDHNSPLGPEFFAGLRRFLADKASGN